VLWSKISLSNRIPNGYRKTHFPPILLPENTSCDTQIIDKGLGELSQLNNGVMIQGLGSRFPLFLFVFILFP